MTLSEIPLSWSIRIRGFHSSLPHSSDLSNSLPPKAYRICRIHLRLHLARFPTPKRRIKYTCLKTHPCFLFLPPGREPPLPAPPAPLPVSAERKPPRPLLQSPEMLGNRRKNELQHLGQDTRTENRRNRLIGPENAAPGRDPLGHICGPVYF